MKTSATLRLKLEDAWTQRSLLSVLAPDNKELPKGLELTVLTNGEDSEFIIESSSPSTVVSTVLALLRDITLFQEVWLLSHGKDGRAHRV